MQTNYEYRRVHRDYGIYEKPTSQIICLTKGKQRAKMIVDHLNKGSGFEGRTPAFFMSGSVIRV